MTLLVGAALAAGILLTASPWMWPAGVARPQGATADGPLRRMVDAAGLAGLQPRTVVVIAAACAVLGAAIVAALTSVPALVVIAGAAGFAGPFLWLRSRAVRLRRSRRAMWPDVCDLLVASVRSGMPLPQAVAAIAVSGPEALRPAFTAFGDDLDASGHFDSSALRLKTALADPVADRIIETLRMARQVGGTELPAVLRALSAAVRQDAHLRGEVEARQSWVRGAAVLGLVAPWVIVVLLALRPEGARAYATPEGIGLIVGGAVVSIVAFRLMLRIGRLPEPRRWFG